MIERVLIVGLGSIGRRHLALTRHLLPSADIRVLRRETGAESPPEANGVLTSLSEAVAFTPQFSIVANPAPFHLPVALALAEAGSHLLVEKPVSHSSTGVADLMALMASRKLRLQVAYNLRFLTSLQWFKQFLLDRRIGDVHSIRCEVGQYLPDWRPGQDYRGTVSAQRALGGGVLLELSHEIDYLRWIFGDIAWVQATLLQQGALGIDVEDSAHMLMGFVGQAGKRPPVANVTLDFIRRDTTRYCLAVGSEGSVRWDGVAGKVQHFSTETGAWSEVFSHIPGRNDTYRMQIESMLAGIATGEPPLVGGADGLAVMNVIDAIRLSSTDDGRRAQVVTQHEGVS